MDKIPFSVYDFFAYLFSGAIILAAVDYVWGTGVLTQKDVGLFLGVAFVIFAYVAGQIVAHISAALFEQLFIMRLLKPPSLILLGDKPRWRVLKWIFPHYHHPLPKSVQERVKEQAFSRNCFAEGEGFFLHVYPIVTANDRMQSRLDEFRNQYGFSRNMAFAFSLAASLIFLAHRYGSHAIRIRWAVLAAVTAICLFYRYLKFFRQYSYELFLRYAELPLPSRTESTGV